MSLYDDLQIVVQELLPAFNQGVIRYGSVTTGAGPADEPGPSSVSWVTLIGAVSKGVSTKYVMRGLAVASDKQVTTMVQENVSPRQKDFVEIDGIKYKITQVLTKPEAGTPVAYVLIVQR